MPNSCATNPVAQQLIERSMLSRQLPQRCCLNQSSGLWLAVKKYPIPRPHHGKQNLSVDVSLPVGLRRFVGLQPSSKLWPSGNDRHAAKPSRRPRPLPKQRFRTADRWKQTTWIRTSLRRINVASRQPFCAKIPSWRPVRPY